MNIPQNDEGCLKAIVVIAFLITCCFMALNDINGWGYILTALLYIIFND